MKILSVLLLFSAGAFAQTAQVIQLSDADAEQARALYKQRDDTEHKIKELQSLISHKYTVSKAPPKNTLVYSFPDHEYSKEGWETGFEYSSDFKFIVPAKSPVANSTGTGPFYWNGCVYPSSSGTSYTGSNSTEVPWNSSSSH